ncbi:ankyrin repeat and SOCS box protein 2-like [Lolium rigidum]|uniref:ankyrin repeat and SOCS box protein 2-like n=1 Tax=Lolium rigidum TaxID=89674 RepID=UPI001F5D59B5|nr:ankyrin repeat and SOCS box protein 2-like [Lolium rigidum]
MENATLGGHCEAVRLLLSKGVPVDPVDHRGAPLHLAASKDHVEVVKFLLEHAADINKVVNHIVSPLTIALCGKSLKCIKLLIEAGADVNALDSSAPTPLAQAVHDGLTDIIKLLLEAGADVNGLGSSAPTPLAQAVYDGLTDIIKLLLEAGADPNIPDQGSISLSSSHLLLSCKLCDLQSWPLSPCIRFRVERKLGHQRYKVRCIDCSCLTKYCSVVIYSVHLFGFASQLGLHQGLIPIEQAAVRRRRELVEVLFPWTTPISCLPDWSVNGIIRTVNYWRINPLQACRYFFYYFLPGYLMKLNARDVVVWAAVSMEERTAYWKSRGKEAFARGDYLTAISCYDKVLDINPSDTPMHANKSLCWLRMRHGRLTLEDARKCKMIRPRWSKAWYREGAALSFMKDYDGAADAFWEALQLDPKSGEIREALRKAEKAAEESWRM